MFFFCFWFSHDAEADTHIECDTRITSNFCAKLYHIGFELVVIVIIALVNILCLYQTCCQHSMREPE